MYRLSDYDYCLPLELIAQRPAENRDASRLLVIDRKRRFLEHDFFYDLPRFLQKGDCLVLNDTKVIPARLIGRRASGGKVEVFLINPIGGLTGTSRCYQALIKPLGRLKEGEEIFFNDKFSCRLLDAKKKIVVFNGRHLEKMIKKIGLIPLPPYIRRLPDSSDRSRYQTIFAKKAGAVAAPTAGLHFTKKLFAAIRKKGVRIVSLTLHVNYGTFAPMRGEDIRDHRMHEEYFEIPASTILALRKAKCEARRVVAVGTTVCKALEASAGEILSGGKIKKIAKKSNFFIYPPFDFKIVDALVTNFHLPKTSLLVMVAAFAGRELMLKAYQEAVEHRYRFYSYGDAMLIL